MTKPLIIAVDLDKTICLPIQSEDDTEERYGKAIPIPSTINAVNLLYDEGHKIILYTARRMLTHKGDVEAVIADVGLITRQWLEKHGVKYHELVFGKIYYDILIDDKAVYPFQEDGKITTESLVNEKLLDI